MVKRAGSLMCTLRIPAYQCLPQQLRNPLSSKCQHMCVRKAHCRLNDTKSWVLDAHCSIWLSKEHTPISVSSVQPFARLWTSSDGQQFIDFFGSRQHTWLTLFYASTASGLLRLQNYGEPWSQPSRPFIEETSHSLAIYHQLFDLQVSKVDFHHRGSQRSLRRLVQAPW